MVIAISSRSNCSGNRGTASVSEGFSEAQAVLSSLGYTNNEINMGLETALRQTTDKNDTQAILQIALSVISGC